MPGAVGGVILVESLPSPPDTALLWGVALALGFTAVVTLVRALFVPKVHELERETVPLTPRMKCTAVGLGLVLGFILGVTSVGSGALIGLALILIFRLTPHRVVGTDVFHAAVLLSAAGIAHVIAGNVDYGLMGNILIGSIPGVLIGERLARSVPANGLRPALGCAMLGSALGVASKAGLDLPAYAILGPAGSRRRVRVLARALAQPPHRGARRRCERDVPVLALGLRDPLGPQRLERGDQLRPCLMRRRAHRRCSRARRPCTGSRSAPCSRR